MPAGLMPRLGRLLPSLGPPLLLFWVSILGFGLQVGKLGFYWDDWAHIWWSQMQGLQGIWASTWYDRPLIGLFTMSLFVLTKWNPLVLHILCWLVSWLTAPVALGLPAPNLAPAGAGSPDGRAALPGHPGPVHPARLPGLLGPLWQPGSGAVLHLALF